MKRLLSIFAISMLTFAPLSAAHGSAFPANNKNACEDVGGTYTAFGPGGSQGSICVVSESSAPVVTKDVGQPGGKAFTVTTTTTTTYTKNQGDTTSTETSSSSTCTNPGGDEVPSKIKPCQ